MPPNLIPVGDTPVSGLSTVRGLPSALTGSSLKGLPPGAAGVAGAPGIGAPGAPLAGAPGVGLGPPAAVEAPAAVLAAGPPLAVGVAEVPVPVGAPAAAAAGVGVVAAWSGATAVAGAASGALGCPPWLEYELGAPACDAVLLEPPPLQAASSNMPLSRLTPTGNRRAGIPVRLG